MAASVARSSERTMLVSDSSVDAGRSGSCFGTMTLVETTVLYDCYPLCTGALTLHRFAVCCSAIVGIIVVEAWIRGREP